MMDQHAVFSAPESEASSDEEQHANHHALAQPEAATKPRGVRQGRRLIRLVRWTHPSRGFHLGHHPLDVGYASRKLQRFVLHPDRALEVGRLVNEDPGTRYVARPADLPGSARAGIVDVLHPFRWLCLARWPLRPADVSAPLLAPGTRGELAR